MEDIYIYEKIFSPDMVIYLFSTSFLKCVNDCGAIPDGVRINHSAVLMVFLNPFIKFKSDYIQRPVIDWKNIKKSHN